MIRSSIAALASAASILAFGAAAAARPSTQALAARVLSDEPIAHRQRHEPPIPAAKHDRSATARTGKAVPLVRVVAANRNAVEEPDAAFYLGAAQVYPWSEGSLYRLYAAPEQISDVALEPGETLVSVAAGDTARWVIGDTSSGSGPARRTHILVKPVAPGLRTNLIIATDRRIYHVEAVSTERTAMATISWTYPQDSLIALRAGPATAPDPAVAPAVAVEALNFGYRIEGDNVAWRPVRAFDDGHQTFIEFPATLGDGEAPPLFVTGTDGKAELVNYRVKGHYYVVDRLFGAAELRLGGKHQQIVRIVRENGERRARRSA
ncbi:MAG TPA: P-type conjugative transfer protein TrbG [Sphingomicrobium sp.]|nr:P-type conjugative transfer protein TrbG [Sphingomicrobium sp.]